MAGLCILQSEQSQQLGTFGKGVPVNLVEQQDPHVFLEVKSSKCMKMNDIEDIMDSRQ